MNTDYPDDLRRYNVALYSVSLLVAGCATVAIAASALSLLPDSIALATVILAVIMTVALYWHLFSPAYTGELYALERSDSTGWQVRDYHSAREMMNHPVSADVMRSAIVGANSRDDDFTGAGGAYPAGAVGTASLPICDGMIREPLCLPQARSRKPVSGIHAAAPFPLSQVDH